MIIVEWFLRLLNDGEQYNVHIIYVWTDIKQNIINFAYSRSLSITNEFFYTLHELMTLAHYFGYASLVNMCVSHAINILKLENVLTLIQ